MRRDGLYVLLGVLVIGIAVLGYLYYQETRSRGGIDIQIDDSGITMEEN